MPHKREFRYKANQTVVGWTLDAPLGIGGQAEVWTAHRNPDDDPIALKLIHNVDRKSEPFLRLRREVEVLHRLGEYPGIVPIVDDDLDGDPPWFAMQIAHTIESALGTTPPLHFVVQAIRDIALTLAQLERNHALGHRDIHPGNLYHYKERWAVGDFGLVHDPSGPIITDPDAAWGRARSFTAPEMIDNPANALPGPADVFSLAKTLYVLAAHMDRPPVGMVQVRANKRAMSEQPIHLQEEERWPFLCYLIEQATSPDARDRISMDQFAEELSAWLASEVGRRPRRRLSFAAGFRERLASFDHELQRRFVRALDLLDRTDDLESQDIAPFEERPDVWRVAVEPGLYMTFERQRGRVHMLTCASDKPQYAPEAARLE